MAEKKVTPKAPSEKKSAKKSDEKTPATRVSLVKMRKARKA